MSIIILSNHSATDKLCVTFYKFYNAFMIFSQFITYTSTLYDLQGVTCTFHSNISPCVNLKNDGFSDFTGTLLSFIKK